MNIKSIDAPRNKRDLTYWKKGYESALQDILRAYEEGGEENVLEWIKNNRMS